MRTSKKLLSVLLAVLMCMSCFGLCLNAAAVNELSSIALACPAPEAGGAFPTVSDVECAPVLQVKSIIIYEVQGNTSLKATAPFEVGKTYEINFSMATRTANYNFSNDLTASVNDEACNAVYLTRTTANVVWTVTIGVALHTVTSVEIGTSLFIPYPGTDFTYAGSNAYAYYDGGREFLERLSLSIFEVKSDGTKVEAEPPFVDGKDYEISMEFSCEDSGSVIKFDASAPPTVEFDYQQRNGYINDELLLLEDVNPNGIVVAWRFKAHHPVLTLLAEPTEGGTFIGAGSYPYIEGEYGRMGPTEATLKAIPNDGYYLVGWEQWTGDSWEDVAEGLVAPSFSFEMKSDQTFRAKFMAYEVPDLTGFTKLDMYPFDTLNPSGWYYDILPIFASIAGSLFEGEANPNIDFSSMNEEEVKEAIDSFSTVYFKLSPAVPEVVYYNPETDDVAFRFGNGLIQKFSDALASGHMDEETNAFWRQCIKYAEPTTYTVTANASAGGSATGGNTYESGATATLTATPGSGYHFTGWYEGSTKVSDKTPYSFTVTKDVTLTAQFEKDADPGNNGGNNNPQPQPSANRCHWCGKDHSGNFFQKIIGFFHNIFAKIFGNKY